MVFMFLIVHDEELAIMRRDSRMHNYASRDIAVDATAGPHSVRFSLPGITAGPMY